MTNYTNNADVNVDHYDGMSSSYHEAAKDYVDNMLIRSAGYDPDDMPTPTPYIIKQISRAYAMEMYAQSRVRQTGDYWSEQHQTMRDMRISFERRFNPTTVFEYLEEKGRGRQGGSSARVFRV